MKLYRFLSEEDTAAFCHKVTAALNAGWDLYGSPTQTWDHAAGVMRCGQAVIKEVPGTYTPDTKLGEQNHPGDEKRKTVKGLAVRYWSSKIFKPFFGAKTQEVEEKE